MGRVECCCCCWRLGGAQHAPLCVACRWRRSSERQGQTHVDGLAGFRSSLLWSRGQDTQASLAISTNHHHHHHDQLTPTPAMEELGITNVAVADPALASAVDDQTRVHLEAQQEDDTFLRFK